MQNRGEGAPAGTSRSLARSPDTYASDPVLVHWLALLLHASFRPRLTATPLRFAITSPYQVVKRTCTSKLSTLLGVPKKRASRPERDALSIRLVLWKRAIFRFR